MKWITELGTIFERNNKIYKIIGQTSGQKVVYSIPVEEPVCEHCGNRFIESDVEDSQNFQESIKPVKTL